MWEVGGFSEMREIKGFVLLDVKMGQDLPQIFLKST